MQNHLHTNQMNFPNSQSIFLQIQLTSTGPQKNEFMNIVVCLRIQLIRGSKSRHKLIGKAHALWRKTSDAIA